MIDYRWRLSWIAQLNVRRVQMLVWRLLTSRSYLVDLLSPLFYIDQAVDVGSCAVLGYAGGGSSGYRAFTSA